MGKDTYGYRKKQKERGLVWGEMPIDKWKTEGRGFSKGNRRKGVCKGKQRDGRLFWGGEQPRKRSEIR